MNPILLILALLFTNVVDWKYSSARNYQDDQTVLEIDIWWQVIILVCLIHKRDACAECINMIKYGSNKNIQIKK